MSWGPGSGEKQGARSREQGTNCKFAPANAYTEMSASADLKSVLCGNSIGTNCKFAPANVTDS